MPKYEPGDIVIVDPDIDKHNGDYVIGAINEMMRKAGQTVTIKEIREEGTAAPYNSRRRRPYVLYGIEEDKWNWDEKMFVGLAETPTTIEISNSDFIKILGVDKI